MARILVANVGAVFTPIARYIFGNDHVYAFRRKSGRPDDNLVNDQF
jgi:hypothetical protein